MGVAGEEGETETATEGEDEGEGGGRVWSVEGEGSVGGGVRVALIGCGVVWCGVVSSLD